MPAPPGPNARTKARAAPSEEPAIGIGVDRHVWPDCVAHGEDARRIDQRIVADLDLQARIALSDSLEGLRRGLLRRCPLDGTVERRRLGAVAAEELPERNAGEPCGEIPARHVDAGLCVRVTGQGAVHRPGDGLRRSRVAADHARPEQIECGPLPTWERGVVRDADRAGLADARPCRRRRRDARPTRPCRW